MHLICHWSEFQRKDWAKIMMAAAVFLLVTVPYAVQYRIWERPDITSWVKHAPSEPADKLTLMWWNMRELSAMGCVPWVVAALGGWFIYQRRKEDVVRKVILTWATLCLAYIAILGVVSPQPVKGGADIADVRYLVPLLPFTAGLVGWVVGCVHRWRSAVAVMLFGVITCCNVLSLNPLKPEFRWLLPAYIKEVHHDNPTSYSRVIEFLKGATTNDDVVVATDEYCNYPLMFYLGDRVRFGCLLDTNTPLPHDLIRSLKAPLFGEENFPDWFIAFGMDEAAISTLGFFSRPHEKNSKIEQFQYRFVTNLNVFWVDTSRPDFFMHTFGPKKDFNPAVDSVYVFQRVAR